MTKFAEMIGLTVTLLLPSKDDEAEEKHGKKLVISLHLHSSHPSPEYRDMGKSHPVRRCHQLAALQADSNPATGAMDISFWSGFTVLRKVNQPWMPSNEFDRVLEPLRRSSGHVDKLWASGVEITPGWLEEMGLRVDKTSARKELSVLLGRSGFKVLIATAK